MEWLKKIQKLWKKLEEDNNHQEVVSIQDQIKNNKQIIKRLDGENLKEALRECRGQVKLESKEHKHKTKHGNKLKKVEHRVDLLEAKVKKETDRQIELNTWGLNH